MTTDLTVALMNRPGTLAQASDALGRAGVDVAGACGFVCDDQGVYHVLVQDAERARRALIDAGFDIQAERTVVVAPIEHGRGEAARLLRRIAEAGVNVDLFYMSVEGELVLGGSDLPALRAAVA